MFRLNIYAGLPAVVEKYENSLRFQTLSRNGTHLGFLGAYVVVPFESIPRIEVFFHIYWYYIAMEKIKNSFGLIFFLLLFVVADFVFNKLHMYDYFDWLDILMHIFGGMLFMWTWFHVCTGGKFKKIMRKPIVHPLWELGVLVIGWEIYRFLTKNIVIEGYLFDTVLDVLVGFGGGLIAYMWFSSRTIKE